MFSTNVVLSGFGNYGEGRDFIYSVVKKANNSGTASNWLPSRQNCTMTRYSMSTAMQCGVFWFCSCGVEISNAVDYTCTIQ